MNGRLVFGMVAWLSVVAFPVAAHADGNLSVVSGQFTDKVEHSKPVGDATALTNDATATYWVEVNNASEATQVTLVWKLDGQEISRQSLDVGHAPRWRTWGTCPTKKAHTLEVQVLDKDGTSLRTDTATIAAR